MTVKVGTLVAALSIMSWMNNDGGEFITWGVDDPDFHSSIQQQGQQLFQQLAQQQQAQQQLAQQQQYQPHQPQYIDTVPDINQEEAQYLAAYQNMNVVDVSTEVITKLRNFASGSIPEWYNEIKTSIEKQSFPNYIKFYFLRLLIEYHTGNYLLGKDMTPAQAAAEVKQSFLNGISLKDAVGVVQTARYQQIVNLPLNNVILEQTGMTEEEAHVFFKFWKKNKEKPDFWESHKTQFCTEEFVFGDNAYQINLSYVQLASFFLGDKMGKLHTNWKNLNETSNGLNILRDLHLSIFENEDFQPSVIDFWTQGKGDEDKMIKENLDFEKLMHAIQGEIGINDFLSVQGTTTIISHNLPFKNLEKAILTLQASGERITAENVAKQFFALGADYQKLKEIAEIRARLADLKRHGTLQARAMLKTLIRDKDKFWQRFNISDQLPENLQHYFDYLENSIRATRHDFMEREFQFADDNRGGDENKWFEEQISILMNSLDETNDKLRNSLKEREAQASNGAKTTMINVEKILQDAIAKRNAMIDEIKNGNIKRDAVKDMLKAKNPEVTNKEIEEEAEKYKDKDIDEAKLIIENEKQISENQWLEVYNYFAEVMSGVRKTVPGQNGTVIEITLLTYSDPVLKTIPEDQYKKLEPRIKKLKEKHKGNADAAIADLKEDNQTRLPIIQNILDNQSEYDKEFINQDWAALLDSYDWDIERWYDYISQVIPKLQTLIKYNSQYDNNYGPELRNKTKPISSIVKHLDDKIVEYQKRQNIIAADQDVMNYISTNTDFITIEEVAGHAKDAKEAKIYINLKVALKNKTGRDCGVKDYLFRQRIDEGFYSKEINGDVIKWDQRMKKENPTLVQEMVKTTEKNQNFYGLPKEKFDDLRYWKDIDDEKWRMKYFEVENNFGVLKKIDPDAKNCKSFEEYIVKKNNPVSSPACSSDKQCFIQNAGIETDNAALQIKNFITRFEEFQKAKYNMISGDFKGEYSLELARQLWNKNINKPHFETTEQCAKWLMDSGKTGEAGISYLVNEVNSRNQSLFADKNFNQVWEKWAKFAADNLVVLEPKDVMAKAVGGYQALQTMLNAIEKDFLTEYFKYYNRIDLAKYFKNKQASNGELKVDPEEIYTGLTNDIQKAKSVIRDFQNTMTSLDNDRIEINKELSREYADQHPEDDYLDIGIELYDTKPCDWESRFKLWGGNINKMKAEILILYYNALCDKQNRLGEKIDPTHMIPLVNSKYGEDIKPLWDLVEKLRNSYNVKEWWENSAEVEKFKELTKEAEVWEVSWDKQIPQLSSVDEALKFMINIMEKQVYPKLTGEGPYDWKDGKTDSAKANWEIIKSAIKKEY
ncbi:hypothetical protein M9Y10_044507 [Tritrichomonas musculus]|uniref:Uncharacterized protein n=1 Tax=Tritrichomonas musculus TaxID=1915356 RepID=A0ABR2JTV1_9EUKA